MSGYSVGGLRVMRLSTLHKIFRQSEKAREHAERQTSLMERDRHLLSSRLRDRGAYEMYLVCEKKHF